MCQATMCRSTHHVDVLSSTRCWSGLSWAEMVAEHVSTGVGCRQSQVTSETVYA